MNVDSRCLQNSKCTEVFSRFQAAVRGWAMLERIVWDRLGFSILLSVGLCVWINPPLLGGTAEERETELLLEQVAVFQHLSPHGVSWTIPAASQQSEPASNFEISESPGKPSSITVGDINGDGISDLVVGYYSAGAGALYEFSGNPLARFPDRGGMDALLEGRPPAFPFLGASKLLEIPVRPDFLHIGDFDGDGRKDILIGELDTSELWLVSRTEEGDFELTRRELNGQLVSLTAGEVHFADGATDFVAAIRINDSWELQIYQHFKSSWSSDPELLPLVDKPFKLAIGAVDDDNLSDIFVAGHHTTTFILGSNSLGNQHRGRDLTTHTVDLPFFCRDMVPIRLSTQKKSHDIAFLSSEGELFVYSPALGEAIGQEQFRPIRALRLPEATGLFRGHYLPSSGADTLLLSTGKAGGVYAAQIEANGQLRESFRLSRPGSSPKNVVAARLGPYPLDDLILLDGSDSIPFVQSSPQQAGVTVNNGGDEPDGNLNDEICDTGAGTPEKPYTGDCTLRAALDHLDAFFGPGGTILIDTPIVTIGEEFMRLAATSLTITGVENNGVKPIIDGSEVTCPGGCYYRRDIPHAFILEGGEFVFSNLTFRDWSRQALGEMAGAILVHRAGNLSVEGCRFENASIGIRFLGTEKIDGSFVIGGPSAASGNTFLSHFKAISGDSFFSGIVVQGNHFLPPAPGASDPISVTLFTEAVIGGTGSGESNIFEGSGTVRVSAGGRIQGNDFSGSNGVALQVNTGTALALIGGNTPGAGNAFFNNSTPWASTIRLGGGQTAQGLTLQMTGNRVGVNREGKPAPNSVPTRSMRDGVITAEDALIGPDNIIAHNVGHAIAIQPQSLVIITENLIYSNEGLGIASAFGTNSSQRPRELIQSADGTLLTGSLDTNQPDTDFRVEIFQDDPLDQCRPGEGKHFVRAEQVKTDSTGKAAFGVSFNPPLVESTVLSATATGPEGTSTFSDCAEVFLPLITVNSTEDAGLKPGAERCETGNTILRGGAEEPECTLRAAIEFANWHADEDTIRFDFPAGVDPIIQPMDELPAITESLTIDARQLDGETCRPTVGLSGALAKSGAPAPNGLSLVKGDILIAGLAVYDWNVGISVGADTVNKQELVCNHIGTGLEGTETGLGNEKGVEVKGQAGALQDPNVVIGGATSAMRNIISGNRRAGVQIDHTRAASIQSNYIGTDISGMYPLGNDFGILFQPATLDGGKLGPTKSLVGGPTGTPGTSPGNLISANRVSGLAAFETWAEIKGNAIGVDSTGRGLLPNLGYGIGVFGSAVQIGGNSSAEGNQISGNFRGILLRAVYSELSIVKNNVIGPSRNPVLPLAGGGGNLGYGIEIEKMEAYSDGFPLPILENVIAFNGDVTEEESGGILVKDSSRVFLSKNRIFDNVGPGIKYPEAGITKPKLEQAVLTQNGESKLRVRGVSFTEGSALEFFASLECDPSGSGEGEQFLGGAATDGGAFDVELSVNNSIGSYITATTVVPGSATSEFSSCLLVQEMGAGGGAVDIDGLILSVLIGGGDFSSFSGGSVTNRPELPSGIQIVQEIGFTVVTGEFSSPSAVSTLQSGVVTVTIQYPEGTRIDSYYNYGATPDNPEPHWYEFLFDGTTGAEIEGSAVILHFVDGGRGDHDLEVNGVIDTRGGAALIGKSFYIPFSQASQAGSFVGFAVSNQSEESQQFQFVPYDEVGRVPLEGAGVTVRRLTGESQLAILANELFETDLEDQTETWTELISSTPETGSFFQFGRLDLSQLDGSVAVDQQGKKLLFTRIFQGAKAYRGQPAATFLSIANPNADAIELLLTLHREGTSAGTLRAEPPVETTYAIPGKGFLYGSVTDLFGEVTSTGGYVSVEVTRGEGAIGFERVQLENRETVIGLNASFDSEADKSYSAQLAWLPGFFTNINLLNSSEEAREVTLTAINADGSRFRDPVTLSLDPGEQYSRDGEDVFAGAAPASGSSQELFVGSLKVEANGAGVVGDILFGDNADYQYAAALPLQVTAFRRAVFNQVANLELFFTGLAFFNPGLADSQVTIEVIDTNGNAVGNTTQTLPAGQRLSQQVDELVPASAGQAGGYVRITSTQPLVAQLLFGALTEGGAIKLFSAVPPTVLE